jgi:glycerol-3-phosphate dehydrogenase
VGLKLYDFLAGGVDWAPSRGLSRDETLALAPTLAGDGLCGGVHFLDCQFDDARFAVSLARTLLDLGGVPINHMAVTGLMKSAGRMAGVAAVEGESGREYRVTARAVVNATGVFGDAVRRLDDPEAEPLLAPSQGTHLILDRAFLPGETAVLIPRTHDGRVLFAIPWCGRVLLGTTDTPVTTISAEPRPLREEIDYLLEHAAGYLNRPPGRKDVLSVFAGLRPLVGRPFRPRSAALSREHAVVVGASGLVSVLGGKWTTYRPMGKDAVDRAAAVAGLKAAASASAGLRLHGWRTQPATEPWLAYGADAEELGVLAISQPGGNELLHPGLPYRECVVTWAVRREFARTVADVLARRTRALFLDAAASMAMAPRVAQLMAAELRRDNEWERQQVADFRALAYGYLPE